MAKVDVHLWSALRSVVGGQEVVTVEATNIGQMLSALEQAHPGLAPVIEAGVSVSIDGRIIAAGLREAVAPENEIYLMQRLKGG